MNGLPHRSWVEIDFCRLENNVRNIKASLPDGVKYVCVVKADAYGHSMPQALLRFVRGGADVFAVANLYEASRVREIIPDKPILVLSPMLKQERPLAFDYAATPAVSSADEARAFARLADERGRPLNVQIKIDTGMGRAGIWHEEAGREIPKILEIGGIKVSGMFSHFSSADFDAEYTKRQAEIFLRLARKYGSPEMLIHIHNSAAMRYLPIVPPLNAVRMGLIQYGINPFPDNAGFDKLNIMPVLSFKSRVLAVSRGARSPIASVCAGYADGVPSGYSKDARVLIRGKLCPIIGPVGLDEFTVDISSAPDARAGDEVTLIGEQEGNSISLPDYSRWTRRIPWETMVAIPKRVARVLKY